MVPHLQYPYLYGGPENLISRWLYLRRLWVCQIQPTEWRCNERDLRGQSFCMETCLSVCRAAQSLNRMRAGLKLQMALSKWQKYIWRCCTGLTSPASERITLRLNLRINPRINPRFNPRINPRFNPRINPRINPRFNPRINPRFNPRINPRINPRTNLRIDY